MTAWPVKRLQLWADRFLAALDTLGPCHLPRLTTRPADQRTADDHRTLPTPPAASGGGTRVETLICTCEGEHPGRPAGDEGCGAFWNLRLGIGPA